MNSPLSSTFAFLISMLCNGILTLSKPRNPLFAVICESSKFKVINCDNQYGLFTCVHSNLVADLANRDSFHRLVRFFITKLHDERLNAMALALRVELGYDDGVVCSMPKTARPPLKLQTKLILIDLKYYLNLPCKPSLSANEWQTPSSSDRTLKLSPSL